MYLKRLEIKGFKSFADHTELNLNPGINIIVGPNGCGKSNIVDAIRWVLGEANVRHLRGSKNEDIIFSGTDRKKALGMAQVDMTVDNSEGTLPLDYSEVTVSRKIFRSGESEFYLNKLRVRMKDIVKLYTDTGLGKKGYSIISQGELERVLNGQPFDRRLMLEEAAGTMRYRQQRDEVLQRISVTTQDLLRVEDILNELESRKNELYNKAERAKTFLILREEHDALEKQVMAFQIKEVCDNLRSKEVEVTNQKSHLQQIIDRLENLKICLQNTEEILADKRALFNSLNDSKHELETELNRMNSDIKLSQERIKNYRERIEAAGNDSEKYILRLEKLEKDIQYKVTEFNQEKSHYEERKCEVDCLSQEIIGIEQAFKELTKDVEKQNQLVFETVNREAEIKNAITDLENGIKKAQEKKERLLIRLDENKEQLLASTKSVRDFNEQIMKLKINLEKWEKVVDDAEIQRDEYLKSQAYINKEYDNINRERFNLEHKISVLNDLQKNYAGYSEGVKTLLKSIERGDHQLTGITGLVANLIQVPSGMEVALDIALGRSIENVVVETAESARKAIQFLKQRHLGRVTFLPLDVLRVQAISSRVKKDLMGQKGVLGIASDLIKYDMKYEKALTYLLGRVLLVQDMDSGMKIFKEIQYPLRIVTLEGELINTNGAMTGGTIKQQQSSPLRRIREEKQINQQLAELRKTELINRDSAADINAKLKLLDGKLHKGRNGRAEIEIQLKIIKDEEVRIRSLLDSIALDKDIYMREISGLEGYILQTEEEMQALQDKYRDIRAENNFTTDEIGKLRTEIETNRREYEVRKERYSSHQEQLEMKKRELENNQKNIAQFDQVKNSYRQSVMEAQTLQERLQIDINIHQERIDSTNQKIEDKKFGLSGIVARLDATRQEEEENRQEMESIRGAIVPLQKQIVEGQDQLRTLEMKTVRLDTELEGLHLKWHEKYESEEFDAFGGGLTSRQIRDYRMRIEELGMRIELLGSIDIDSIKEYDDLKVRYDFLQQQTEDLSAAKISLQKLLQETEKIMASNFSKFMALADESFKRTFMEIFNGGEASLKIETVTDLAAGVDIVVKMPGKRSQSLNLLSGGERALTCIAFIFSLLRLKPAPFCLMDEIDASLDEINLQRFADFLRGMSTDTQFIVVTHRQATIEAGSNIYGITMPQEGISSVLSINCDKVHSLAG